MALTEGLERIKRAGTAIALWGGLAGFLLWVLLFIILGRMGLPELVLTVGFPVCFGVALRVIIWISEGFLAPPVS